MTDLAKALRRPLLEPVLLMLLSEAPGHGYGLTQRVEAILPGTDTSPVYRALRDLQRRGLVDGVWSPAGRGPVPRVYELTTAGRARLWEMVEEVRTLCATAHVVAERARAGLR